MESWNIHVAMIEITILEVKSDALTWVHIIQGENGIQDVDAALEKVGEVVA